MAREVRLWEWLRDGLKPVRGLHMRRVENLVSSGDPDVDGCYRGVYFEIELKGCDRPPRNGPLKYEIRKAQEVWHNLRHKAGGNNWVYVRVGKGKDVRRYLIPGRHAGELEGADEERLLALAELDPQHDALELLERVTSSLGTHEKVT